jgi:PIN domain nuclease of toxin-antitoxin system
MPIGRVRLFHLTPEIAIDANALPGVFHDDPADRLITATARVHHLTLVTSDTKMIAYPHVRTLSTR